MYIPIEAERHARLLCEYCLSVRRGDLVVINGTYESLPLMASLVKEVVSRGAYPYSIIYDELLQEVFFMYAPSEVLSMEPKIDKYIIENADCAISILASTHTRYLSSVDPEKLKIAAAARRNVQKIFLERAAKGELRWVVTPYPTKALAQEAGMSLTEFARFVFRALKLDEEDPVAAWRKQAEFQERVCALLSKVDELKVIGNGVDLLAKFGGRKWINDDGKNNMPGGEVFSAPHEDSIEGWIRFDYPSMYRGYEVEGVKLVFKKGVVVEADAVKGKDVLLRALEVDDGAKRVGEFAFGLNYSINRCVRNTLFDEKIGGTIHLALGAAYPETGGKNVSAIHWDLVKDCRNVKVYADGDLVYENGRFLESVL
ncbi:MAG: aminopeptidase [Crenarchaeota archaeon]|nr:aminopeptidase [Thermoproteota archaeon]